MIASFLRTVTLSLFLPIIQGQMVGMSMPQSDIDALLGNLATVLEAILAMPSFVLLFRQASLDAALASAVSLVLVEVAGKHAFLTHVRLRHEGNAEGLRRTLDIHEVRLVYEEIGEKMCIVTAPFIALMMDRNRDVPQLVRLTVYVLAVEEIADVLLIIMCAQHEVNVLRVKPRASGRYAVALVFALAGMYCGMCTMTSFLFA